MEKVYMREIIKQTAAAVNLPIKQVEPVVKAVFEVLEKNFKDSKDVTIANFGTFKTRVRSARKVRTPQGKTIEVPEKRTVVFKPGKKLVERINAG